MIFISHSSKDAKSAEELRDKLQENYYQCFLSSDNLESDDDWYEEIWKNLKDCHAFLGIVTRHFYKSAFCQQELGAALALSKPLLLISYDKTKPPGFAGRFQACNQTRLISTLDNHPKHRSVRVEAWIAAVREVQNFKAANSAHDRFLAVWDGMSKDEKMRWLVAAAGNNQVAGEGFKAGPFFKQAKRKLHGSLTNQWLYENDKDSRLHNFDRNPINTNDGRKKTSKKVKAKP